MFNEGIIMDSLSAPIRHPGTFVREHVIPAEMTVTEAAKRLGIGRPALSDFLNGKSTLSQKMAGRLERAFGADRQQLLELQSVYGRQQQHANERNVAVRPFVPSFLTIRANQIENWANSQIDARTHLPVLLRKLVQSTGSELHRVDFPGYDNAQRQGSDGFIWAAAATPWIPHGTSYWEFGTDKKPGGKADKDYAARLKSVDLIERANSTCVCVTPCNWPGKTDWEKQKNDAGDWKAVRALDASDLEQWLEQSVPAQIWLAEQIGLPISGYETLEHAWARWANASEPHLTSDIFAPSIEIYRDTFKKWLDSPSDKQFVIAADSRDEALAFLACLFDEDGLHQSKDQTAVFTSPTTLRTLITSSMQFIPIVHSENVERELVDAHLRLHCIIFRPRNAVDIEADITLDLLGIDAFEKALMAAGVERSDVDRLARESGCSPTILRRRLSKNAAIRTPVWAGDNDTAKTLVPMAMIGAWHAEPEADQEIITYLADRPYEEIERDVAQLLQYDDSPMWSAGRHRGVTSKIDALFAIAKMVTPEDLERFFFVAEIVLSENDPALELPKEKRWAAALYGKTRDHSAALRDGVSETLVILSVHGNNLFQNRLGIDVEHRVSDLIRKLLTPLTLEKLLAHDRDLPRYAEASPEMFLRTIEDDLRQKEPIISGLLKPVNRTSMFESPSRTGLLWALECLAWNPHNLARVSKILAQLSMQKIDDNWMNKPEASLQAIFRSWMPQTAATVQQRVTVLRMLVEQCPGTAWEICIEQIKPGSRMGLSSYRPRWRSDASGAGHVVINKEIYDFTHTVLEFLTDWQTHNEKTLGDLVEALHDLPENYQKKIWDLIDEWSEEARETAKAMLRERIRRFALTRRARHLQLGQVIRDRAREAYNKLQPKDPVIHHGWLFENHYVQESAEEIEEEDFDWQKRDEHINTLRHVAMDEIWTQCGFDGVERLLKHSNTAHTVGHYAVLRVETVEAQVEFVRWCLSIDGNHRNRAEWCLQGALSAIADNLLTQVLQTAAEGMTVKEQTRLFVFAPFQASTWRLLDGYDDELREGYWKDVIPSWNKHTAEEHTELIDRLLEAQRPRAAFQAVRMEIKDVETSRLKRLLRYVATVDAEPAEHFKVDRYHISKAFDSLSARPGVTRDEMAELEFLFIDALSDSKHGIPNLEDMVSQFPVSFVQAISLVYKRNDDGQDPPEWRIENPDRRAAVANAAYRLLDQAKKIPGTDKTGKIDAVKLAEWLARVRHLCREHAREEIGDHCLGQLLSKAPEDEDGTWPCRAVCKTMEDIASSEVSRGFVIGIHNSRGAIWRDEGGQQERSLAEKYRTLAERLRFDYPYVGQVLEDIAISYDHEAGWHDSKAAVAKRFQC